MKSVVKKYLSKQDYFQQKKSTTVKKRIFIKNNVLNLWSYL